MRDQLRFWLAVAFEAPVDFLGDTQLDVLPLAHNFTPPAATPVCCWLACGSNGSAETFDHGDAAAHCGARLSTLFPRTAAYWDPTAAGVVVCLQGATVTPFGEAERWGNTFRAVVPVSARPGTFGVYGLWVMPPKGSPSLTPLA
mmetsp:Transcript_204/g.542  ORF Transcript_204/g.542 Transcript_204/m.542 type:complete len:144 (+) Transcript_204:1787-2218(+)